MPESVNSFGGMKQIVFTCVDCESVHFYVCWNHEEQAWAIGCEGCGNIYLLDSNGTAQLKIKGVADAAQEGQVASHHQPQHPGDESEREATETGSGGSA